MSGLVVLAVMMASPAVAEYHPQPLGPLWRKGSAAILVTQCKSGSDTDASCRGLALRQGGTTRQLGNDYMQARLLWSRTSAGAGPDALVLGESGGSGGYGELFAITLAPRPVVKTFASERLEGMRALPSSASLHFDLLFDIEYFNGAPHAGAVTVPIPTIWKNGDFAADMPALLARRFSPDEIRFRLLALREELDQWAGDAYPADSLYPPQSDGGTPVTVTALVEMILTGNADQAHDLLQRAWPRSHENAGRSMGGEEAFWKALCKAMVREPLWQRLRLDRLPHADIIEAAATAR